MTAHVIDGRAIALKTHDEIRTIIKDKSLKPSLAIILANNNPASHIYVSKKIEACKNVGIDANLYHFDANTPQSEILSLIHTLNQTSSVHGIFIQLPLFENLDAQNLVQSISPHKDIDGLTYDNLGRLMSGSPSIIPCTPMGVMKIFEHEKINLSGKYAVIIGRSVLFGIPMGQLLLGADATVTQCHSKTKNLSKITAQADILICATGQPEMVKGDWVKSGAVVIDVGITRVDNNKIVGDVDFESASKIASSITPVPGGVGPMTVACLLGNVVKACERQS
jgi:methylenetetrahydrofolate dehydrogenase (NADP+)/methenyltetrahydrofolate cyclohydrolase